MQSLKKIHAWAQMQDPLYKLNHHKMPALICIAVIDFLNQYCI